MRFPTAQFAESRTPRWRSLPHKGQLALLFFARLVDVFQNTSLQAYIYYQLQSFEPEMSDAGISTQMGWLFGIFAAAQACMALVWARVADNRWVGRKGVLLIGLFGNCLSCIGIGISESFGQMMLWRVLGGALNANAGIVTVAFAEFVKEKELQPHGFLLLTLSQNTAALLGPVVGSSSINLIQGTHSLQHFDEFMRRKLGLTFFARYPFALPSFLSAWLLITVGFFVVFGLRETLDIPPSSEHQDDNSKTTQTREERMTARFRMWTWRMILVLAAQASLDFHIAAFNHLWPVFLSTPAPTDNAPIQGAAGLGMSSSSVGFAIAMIGGIGLVVQIAIYPRVSNRFGSPNCYRWSSILFPLAYALTPVLVILAMPTASSTCWHPIILWLGIAAVLLLQVTGRIFSVPAAIVLLNSCVTHPSRLSTVHGTGQVVSSAFRTLGPISSGYIYSASSKIGNVGLPWWTLSLVSLFGCLVLFVTTTRRSEQAEKDLRVESFEIEELL